MYHILVFLTLKRYYFLPHWQLSIGQKFINNLVFDFLHFLATL